MAVAVLNHLTHQAAVSTEMGLHQGKLHMKLRPPSLGTLHHTVRVSGFTKQYYLTLWRRFFLILAHPVYKMWITQEPKKVALWNKRHFGERKRRGCSMFKIFCTYICWITYKMQHLEVSGAVRHIYIYIYIYVVRQLRVNKQSLHFSRSITDVKSSLHGIKVEWEAEEWTEPARQKRR